MGGKQCEHGITPVTDCYVCVSAPTSELHIPPELNTPAQRLENWFLAVSEGGEEPEKLFAIAEDACERITELERENAALKKIETAHRETEDDIYGEPGEYNIG